MDDCRISRFSGWLSWLRRRGMRAESESVMRDCLVSPHHSSFACGSCREYRFQLRHLHRCSTFARIFDVRSTRVAMFACSLFFSNLFDAHGHRRRCMRRRSAYSAMCHKSSSSHRRIIVHVRIKSIDLVGERESVGSAGEDDPNGLR